MRKDAPTVTGSSRLATAPQWRLALHSAAACSSAALQNILNGPRTAGAWRHWKLRFLGFRCLKVQSRYGPEQSAPPAPQPSIEAPFGHPFDLTSLLNLNFRGFTVFLLGGRS